MMWCSARANRCGPMGVGMPGEPRGRRPGETVESRRLWRWESAMGSDLNLLVAGLVTLAVLLGVTLAVGRRVLSRLRARSREINAQIEGIHRQLADIEQRLVDFDRQFGECREQLGRLDDLTDQHHRRLFHLEELATLDRAAATARLARIRGSLSDEAQEKLLQHLLEVREALEVATERGER